MNSLTEVNEIICTPWYFSDISDVYFAAELLQQHKKVLPVYLYQPRWLMETCRVPEKLLVPKPNVALPPVLFLTVYKAFKSDIAQEAGVSLTEQAYRMHFLF